MSCFRSGWSLIALFFPTLRVCFWWVVAVWFLGMVMVFLFMQASGSALVPLKYKAWIPSEAPFGGLMNLWFFPHFASLVSLCTSGAGDMGGAAMLSHHAKKWMGEDAFRITWVHCKLDGPWGLSRCLVFEALKKYLGAVCKGFLLQFLLSDTNAKLFCFQRNKFEVPGWLFLILSKGWISQCWISSAGSSAFMYWSEKTDLSS